MNRLLVERGIVAIARDLGATPSPYAGRGRMAIFRSRPPPALLVLELAPGARVSVANPLSAGDSSVSVPSLWLMLVGPSVQARLRGFGRMVGCKRRVARALRCAAVEKVVALGEVGFGGGCHRGANAKDWFLVLCQRDFPWRCRTTNKIHIKIKNQPTPTSVGYSTHRIRFDEFSAIRHGDRHGGWDGCAHLCGLCVVLEAPGLRRNDNDKIFAPARLRFRKNVFFALLVLV